MHQIVSCGLATQKASLTVTLCIILHQRDSKKCSTYDTSDHTSDLELVLVFFEMKIK